MNNLSKLLFLGLAFLLITAPAGAQNTLAKIKYELAEEAFEKNDFKTAISELDGAEKILGSTNPKILYLRIQAQFKLIEANPLVDFSIIEDARKNCAYYMKQYESNEGIEDKLKEVYLISEKLKKQPASKEEFVSLKRQKAVKQKEEAQKELEQKQKAIIAANTTRITNNKKDHAAYNARGIAKTWLKDYEGALADFEKAIEYSKKTADYYANRGVTKAWLKNNAGALDDYTIAISMDSKTVRFYSLRSNLRFALKDDKGALEDIDAMVALNPDSSNYEHRANFKRLVGDYAGAIADYSKAIELTGGANDNYILGRSAAYVQNGNYTAAIDDISRAISLKPGMMSLYYQRGKILQLYLQDKKTAADDFTRAINATPAPTVALSHYFLGNKTKAIQMLDQLIKDNPENAASFYYAKTGLYCFDKNKEEALANLRLAFEKGYSAFRATMVEPNFSFIKELPEFKALIDQYAK